MSISSDFAGQDRASLLGDTSYAEPQEPGFLGGSIAGGMGRGVVSGLGQLALQAAQYGNDPDQAILMNVPTDEEELARREAIGRQRQDFAKSIRPSADANGKASQIMFDLSDSMTRFGFGMMAGGLPVAAFTVGASTGEQQYSSLRTQGVDTETAAKAGALQGVAGTAMAFMPAARFVKPLLGDAAIATGLNVGIGVAQRGSTAALLERSGYIDQAKQFAPFDREAILTDGILGALFFGAGRLASRGGPAPQDVDAGFAATNARNHIVDSAPGAPVDLRSEVNHQRLMDHVSEQVNRGEPVTIPEWYSGEFLVRDRMEPLMPGRESIEAMAADRALPDFISRAEFAAARAVPNVADLRQEMAGLQRSLDGLDGTFRGRAKQFQDEGQGRKKAEASARAAIAEDRQAMGQRQDEINSALDGNRQAELAKADLAALRRGEQPQGLLDAISARADEVQQGFQQSALSRRVAEASETPADRMMDQHISELAADSGFSRADVGLDSVRAELGSPAQPPARQAPKPAKDSLKASKPKPVDGDPVSADAEKQAAVAPDAVPKVTDIDLAREAVSRNPDAMVNSGYDADGNAQQSKASDVMAAIEAEHQAGVKEAQSFMAAVKCLLGA